MDRPLLQEAEGKDQDQRAMLLAAFYRILGNRGRRESYDLHVRELLTYVLVHDRDGRGCQLSYDDIGRVLCCERRAARAIVDRAEREYGLLAVTESRFQRGGQAPNRYAIDWVEVKSVNMGSTPESCAATACHPIAESGVLAHARHPKAGDAGGHPGAARSHPGDAGRQGGDAGGHPYKEDTLSSSLALSLKDKAAAAKAAAAGWVDVNWEEVRRRANQLRLACPTLEREFIWQLCVVMEQICPGQIGGWISRLRSGGIEKHHAWLDGAVRSECRQCGVEWAAIRRLVPTCPPPPESMVDRDLSLQEVHFVQ